MEDQTSQGNFKKEETPPKMLFAIPMEWQNYLSSLFLIIVFPLAPIFIVDYMIINEFQDISAQSLTITAAIYFITIGFSSNNKLTLLFGILGCFAFAVIYGRIEPENLKIKHTVETITELEKVELQQILLEEIQSKNDDNRSTKLAGILCILFISIVHGIERYNRHVLLKEPFFQIL